MPDLFRKEMKPSSTLLIYAVTGFFLALPLIGTLYGADTGEGRRKELQRIKREMREKKKEIRQADRRERSILTDLEQMDRDIQAGKAELTAQQRRLFEAEAGLKDVEKNNSAVSRELDGLKQLYSRRIRALYKMSRNGYPAALILSGGPDSGRLIKYTSLIAERDRKVMEDYETALNALADRQAEIAEKRAALAERKRTLETKKAELESRKKRKAVLLAGVREKKSLSEQALSELEESSANLWAMIRRAEQERKVAKPVRPPLQPSAPAAGTAGKLLPWPLQGRVLTRFGMQRHPELKTMVFRRGIEIAASEGESVHAVADGQVVYADWFKGYGKLMIIEHGPGFYTLYGYLSRLDLNQGDQAARGQVIGLAGETGSLKGSKLYFEVRRNGEAQDPLTVLAKR